MSNGGYLGFAASNFAPIITAGPESNDFSVVRQHLAKTSDCRLDSPALWYLLKCTSKNSRYSEDFWSGRPGSNWGRPAWEAGILPLNYARSTVDCPMAVEIFQAFRNDPWG